MNAAKFAPNKPRRKRVECDLPSLSTYVFKVSPAFLVALDVRTVERADEDSTHTARQSARAEGLGEEEIMKIRRFRLVLTIGEPPLYSFKEHDLLHTHDERFAVQVRIASPDYFGNKKIDGEIVFYFYDDNLIGTYTCTQSEFASLLQTGICSRLNINIASCQRNA